MKTRFRLITRNSLKKAYYCVDTQSGKRWSLGTDDRDRAEQLVVAKNQSLRQPTLNLQIARVYLAGSDSGVATRTWQQALETLIANKKNSTQQRWVRASKDPALATLRPRIIVETNAEHLLSAINAGTVSTNVHLCKLHNYCGDMGWLPWPLLPKRQWPAIEFKDPRAITDDEHRRIVAREPNEEMRSFYELCWHFGGSQSDMATLTSENFDLTQKVVTYHRQKTKSLAQLHYGDQAAATLAKLPRTGHLFPRLAVMDEKHRAKEFKRAPVCGIGH